MKWSTRHETNSVRYGSSDTCQVASQESFKVWAILRAKMLYIYKALFHFSVSASRPTQQLRDLPPIKGFARSWRMQLSQLNLPSTLLLLLCRLKTFTTVLCARLGLRPRTPLVSMLCLIFKRRVDILWGHMTIKYTNLYMSIQFTSCSPRPWGTSITWPLSPRCCAGRSSSGSRYSFDQYMSDLHSSTEQQQRAGSILDLQEPALWQGSWPRTSSPQRACAPPSQGPSRGYPSSGRYCYSGYAAPHMTASFFIILWK